jgi:hypothetical protein
MTPTEIAAGCRQIAHPDRMTGPAATWLLSAADTIDALAARVAELEATLANERGEGEPPSPHWTPCFDADGRFWRSPRTIVGLLADGWHWTVRRGRVPSGVASTARDAMRAADEALVAQARSAGGAP